MRTFVMGLLLLLLLPVMANSAVTADIAFRAERYDDKPARLYADVRMHGIERGEAFLYAFQWNAPEGGTLVKTDGTVKQYNQVCFLDSVYSAPHLWAGDAVCAKCQCYCADTGERGCWRTHSYRSIEYQMDNGLMIGSGVWTVKLVRPDASGGAEVLASASVQIDANGQIVTN